MFVSTVKLTQAAALCGSTSLHCAGQEGEAEASCLAACVPQRLHLKAPTQTEQVKSFFQWLRAVNSTSLPPSPSGSVVRRMLEVLP